MKMRFMMNSWHEKNFQKFCDGLFQAYSSPDFSIMSHKILYFTIFNRVKINWTVKTKFQLHLKLSLSLKFQIIIWSQWIFKTLVLMWDNRRDFICHCKLEVMPMKGRLEALRLKAFWELMWNLHFLDGIVWKRSPKTGKRKSLLLPS